MGRSSCCGGIYVLAVVDSSLFVSGGGYEFTVGFGPPLKGGSRPCRDEASGSSRVLVVGSSLVVVGASCLPVAWGFLSICGVLMSSFQVSSGAPL